MLLKNSRILKIQVRKAQSIILNLDDRNRFAAFFSVLMAIDKRLQATRRKSKKSKVKCGDMKARHKTSFILILKKVNHLNQPSKFLN